jgi:hypothetical protein
MGEGGAEADNNNNPDAVINVLSTTKDTEVGQETEGGGKGGMGKEEPRTADVVATPAVVATTVVALEEKTNGGQWSSSPPIAPL